MYGAPDDLRCRACANKRFPAYEPPVRQRRDDEPALVSGAVLAAAVLASLLWWTKQPLSLSLVADPPDIWSGQLWRLVTSTLPHGGLLHIVFNLYWLWILGRPVERWMGPGLYAGFFMLVSAGSSAAEVLTWEGGIGLSGFIYGLFGLLYALRRDKEFAAALMQPQTVGLFVGWFFLCIILTYTGTMNVGNMAHGAGAVLGFLFGQAVLLQPRARLAGIVGVCVFCLVVVGASAYRPWYGFYAVYRADHYYSAGARDKALEWYVRALAARPDDPRIGARILRLAPEEEPSE
jgi:membrane associated rhomboid family serine protease